MEVKWVIPVMAFSLSGCGVMERPGYRYYGPEAAYGQQHAAYQHRDFLGHLLLLSDQSQDMGGMDYAPGSVMDSGQPTSMGRY